MDARLAGIKRGRSRLTAISRKLGIVFLICFIVYCLAIAAISFFILLPPEGFFRIGNGTISIFFLFVLSNAASAFALFLISRIFAEMGCGESPFNKTRVRQLQALGLLFIFAAISNSLIVPGAEVGVQSGDFTVSFYSGQPAGGSPDLDINSWLIAIVCFMLSMIFKYGALLQQEADDLM